MKEIKLYNAKFGQIINVKHLNLSDEKGIQVETLVFVNTDGMFSNLKYREQLVKLPSNLSVFLD